VCREGRGFQGVLVQQNVGKRVWGEGLRRSNKKTFAGKEKELIISKMRTCHHGAEREKP